MMEHKQFDQSYYNRYYLDGHTRVAEPAHFERLARFIHAYVSYLDIDIRTIVDMGCGIGTLRSPLKKRFRGVRYQGVDISPYACDKYGWENSCISEFVSNSPFDLVVCNDAVQYLSDRKAARTIKNFAELSRAVLYFSVLTKEDWQGSCDQSRTDGDVYIRSAAWYRRRLQRNFINLGGGLYLNRECEAVVYALESCD